eukprot:UN02240
MLHGFTRISNSFTSYSMHFFARKIIFFQHHIFGQNHYFDTPLYVARRLERFYNMVIL